MRSIRGLLIPLSLTLCGLVLAEDFPALNAEVEVSRYLAADKCYVLFLLESSGTAMTRALEACGQTLQGFSARLHGAVPDAVLEVVAVNLGTSGGDSYAASDSPAVPAVTKVLMCTIPPDESLAVRVLDIGIEAGLTPFCAETYDGAHGAVYYGVSNEDEAVADLYDTASQKLRSEANRLAGLMGQRTTRMVYAYRVARTDPDSRLRFRDISVRLPVSQFGTVRERVRISLTLHGAFEISPSTSDE